MQDARAAHVQTVHTPVSTETAPASWRQARGAIPGTQCVYWPTIHTLPPTSFRPGAVVVPLVSQKSASAHARALRRPRNGDLRQSQILMPKQSYNWLLITAS